MNGALGGNYDLGLVLLSFAIAVLASYTALDLTGKVKIAAGQSHYLWLFGGAIAMGIGIWSMHFVAMLAFYLPMPVNYEVTTTLLSLFYAIFASGIALWLSSRQHLNLSLFLFGGSFMGIAIALMHYQGMAAMRMQAIVKYNFGLVILSIAIAIFASFAALWLAFQVREDNSNQANRRKLMSAVVMGIAISGMHYTGMFATHFLPQTSLPLVSAPEIKPSLLAILIGIATIFLLGITLLSSLFNKKLTLQLLRETAISESEQRFRSLVEATSDWVWEIDRDFMYTYASPQVFELIGYTPEEIVGKSFFDSPSPAEASEIELILNLMAKGQPLRCLEKSVLHKDGCSVIIETNAIPIFNGQGSFCGYRGIDRNISERKRTELQLRESKQLLQLVFDTLPQRVFWKDKNSVFLGCNKLLACDAGLESPEQIIGKTDGDFFDRESAANFRRDDLEVMTSGIPRINYEELQTKESGATLWLRTSKIPLCDRNGEIIGVFGSYEDITANKQVEAELKLAKEKADAVNRAKSEFLANMSHELRTPLNGILGYAQILLQSSNISTKEKEGIELINRCGSHLLTLINDILDFSTIESGEMTLNPEEIHFKAFIEEIFEIARITARQKGIESIYQAAGNLPKGIQADERRLRQVLMHLLNNAIKFTDRGKVTFDVSAKKVADRSPKALILLRFQVEDSGIGIDRDRLDNLFSAFEQMGLTKQTSQGTGLGLAISQKIVAQMGGKIQVQSQLDKGSTFWFEVELPETTACRSTIQFERNHTIIGSEDNLEIVPPGLEDINILLTLSRKGLINDLLSELERIEQLDKKLLPFTQKLRQLAKSFQLRDLRQAIEHYLS
jgi:PAS domain S-box-containing protein